MASASFSYHQLIVQNYGPFIKPRSKAKMFKHTQLPLKKSPSLQVRSSFKDKVFENQSEGIICYRDEISGEIICEGLDEGPRFHQHLPRTAYPSRDAEIINLLQQRLLQVVNGGELKKADNGVAAVQEDFKWNGFNKFY
ncbi:uncharacterized protein LOC110613498 [Manihot esculenta]|uniref:Uncharacterized protein n=1 Tax=Manihot esculenta TaxID=3983 RepID=A0A2C9W461_MANES|nr:uncharacterized protein LOC110613498 [Manihot esculenta]OAY53275.1 hypothetical protein MANES_04G150600v8 [Manihot esculenta]